MKCQQCGHPNPEDNRFCGMCGQKLEMRSAPAPSPPETPARSSADRPQTRTAEYTFEDRSQSSSLTTAGNASPDLQREIVRDREARNPARDARVFASSVANRAVRVTTPEEEAEEEFKPPAHNKNFSTGIGGPSILGIGYDSGASSNGLVYDKPRNDGFIYDTDGETPEYLLDDQPSRTVSWRAWALLGILLVGGALGYIQWRASRHEGPDLASILEGNGAATTAEKSLPGTVPPGKQGPAASQPEKPNADDTKADAAAPTSPDSKSSAEKSAANDAADANASTKSSENSEKDETASTSNDAKDGDSKDAEMTASAETKPSDEAKPESDESTAKATKSPHTRPAPVEEASAEQERSRLPKSLGDKDPLIIQAENYIQGRRVRQNCSQGVNLLREAVGQGNPAADVKLGALYWSGTCVTQSKVTAYQWFTRAHEKQPRNIWIERSRNSLWASMSSQEKQRVGH